MNQKVRIIFVIDTLSKMVGGGQRVLSLLANKFSEEGFEVKIISFVESGVPFFPLSSRVAHQVLSPRFIPDEITPLSFKNLISKIFSSVFLWQSLRRALKSEAEGSLVIGFGTQTSVFCIAAALGLKLKIISSEHAHPISTGLLGRFIRNQFYKWVDGMSVLTEDAVSHFPKYLHKKIKVIPNPILSTDLTRSDESFNFLKPFVLGVGRLASQKRFDLLIEAFSQISKKVEPWNLVIAGDGPDRKELEEMVLKLGLQNRVHFLGAVKNIHALYKTAELFVLCSPLEGWPMALAEAMSCGLATIAVDAPGGSRDLIRNKTDGLLVRLEKDDIANAIHRLISNFAEREQMGRNARDVLQRFSDKKVSALWQDFFASLKSEPKSADLNK